jgi:eukaryotic-like serine/threonine-protein kinase
LAIEPQRPSGTLQLLDLAGRILKGRYVVTRALGTGGMGVVYEGLHLELGRPVAIKVIRPEAPANALRRFRQEALAAAAIQHPNVVAVTDLHAGSEDDGEDPPFLVMELLQGRSLAQLLAQRQRLPVPQAVSVAAQTLEGLAAAHDRGIVHRDVKPANVFLLDQPDGRWLVKILDFGIAKLLEDEHGGLTTTGAFVGTPSFAAPEQILGGLGIDARADIHAISATLFTMLTGAPPFRAPSTNDVVVAILRPERPRIEHPDVPPALADVVLRGMARERDERWPSARAMVEALRPFLDARATPPPPTVEAPPPLPSPAPVPQPMLAEDTRRDEPRRRPRPRTLFLRVTVTTLAVGLVGAAVVFLLVPRPPAAAPAPMPSLGPAPPEASASEPPPSASATTSPPETASAPSPDSTRSPPPPARTWAFWLEDSQNVVDPEGWLRAQGAALQAACGRRRSCYGKIEVEADGSTAPISYIRDVRVTPCDRTTTDCLMGFVKKHPITPARCKRDAARCTHSIFLRLE